jgi:hypothetical protein
VAFLLHGTLIAHGESWPSEFIAHKGDDDLGLGAALEVKLLDLTFSVDLAATRTILL